MNTPSQQPNYHFFENNEEEYLKWKNIYEEEGLILNIKAIEITLHNAGCANLKQSDGTATTGKSTKLCSLSKAGILEGLITEKLPEKPEVPRLCCGHVLNGVYYDPKENEEPDYSEGNRYQVKFNRYERSSKARNACITHYGLKCSVCEMNFVNTYGRDIGEGFIHVHHLIPLSERSEAYEVDPINDLRPVCPNCHSMLHKRRPPLSIEDLKDILVAQKPSTKE